MLRTNVETYLECDRDYEEADIVLFGAPFDSSTSFRPGTRFGSSAIRHESFGLESYSPYQDRDLRDYRIMDSGDLELSFGNTKLALADIEERAGIILNDGKIPFMLGGEHLVTLGAFQAAIKKFPDIHMIHFDAHADLRSGDREEFYWGKDHVKTRKFDFEGLEETLEQLKDVPIYFTLDLDVLDPSVFPGTGTPEPGGVSFEELRKAATLVCQKGNVAACDVNELSPHYVRSERGFHCRGLQDRPGDAPGAGQIEVSIRMHGNTKKAKR